MVFDTERNWQFGPANATGVQYDFESVAVHELGHAQQLGHVIAPGTIMHFNIGQSQNRRVLSTNDIDGGNFVQNRSTTIQHCGLPLMTNSACSLSISEEELNANISIYPNPNNGEFFIKKASFINLEKVIIFDVSGRLIAEYDISDSSNTKIINLKNSVSEGVYFANIHSDFGVITKKIILH